MKKTLALVLVMTFVCGLFLTASCSKKTVEEKRGWATPRDSAYFETKELNLAPSAEDPSVIFQLKDSCATDEQIALLVKYMNTKTQADMDTVVVLLDSEGQETSRFSPGKEMNGFQATAVTFTVEKQIAVLGITETGATEILIFSGSGDTPVQSISISGVSFYVSDFACTVNGWALLGDSDIALTDPNGNSIFETPMDSLSNLIVDKEKICILVHENESNVALTTIQLDSLQVTTVSESQWGFPESLNAIRFAWCGPYAIDSQGIYKFDFNKMSVTEIADWNRIDMPPAKMNFPAGMFVLNDDTVLRMTPSTDGLTSDELLLLKHRDIDPNVGKKVITIGGYSSQTALMDQAIYLYNTGDHEYRVQLVDYMDKYPFSDAAGLARANAEIIIAMNSGKGDDMFAGIEMNFDSWGQNEILMDLSEFLGKDPDIDMGSYLPVMTQLTAQDGKLYRVFPAFSVYGYVGYQDCIGTDSELTVRRVLDLSQTLSSDQKIFANVSRTNLGIAALIYHFSGYITDEGFSIPEKDFNDILKYADTFGYNDISTVQNINTGEAYVTGQLLFQEAMISSPSDYWRLDQSGTSSMTYYGFPSAYDSARVCMPDTMIGVSTGTDAPEACREFLEVLLSDEIQEAAIKIGRIPVSQSSFEEQIASAMTASDSGTTSSGTTSPKPMSEESAQQYRACVDSLNCINNMNIDLWTIFRDELESYYTEGKSPSDVRATMMNRVNIYINE